VVKKNNKSSVIEKRQGDLKDKRAPRTTADDQKKTLLEAKGNIGISFPPDLKREGARRPANRPTTPKAPEKLVGERREVGWKK